jgi:hypothetical protein
MALTRVHNRLIAGAPVNVKDFGAVGDGVTDDTAAIQAAVDTNKPVQFGSDTYKITAPLVQVVTAPVIWLSDGATISFESATHVEIAVFFADITGVEIILNDITITGNKLANVVLYVQNNTSNTTPSTFIANNLTVTGAKRLNTFSNGNGILVHGAFDDVRFNGCKVSDCELPAGQGTPGSIGITGMTVKHYSETSYPLRCTLNGTHIEQIYSSDPDYLFDQDGIKFFGPTTGAGDKAPSTLVVEGNCRFVNCYGRSIKTQCRNTVVRDSHFERDTGLNYVGVPSNPEVDAQYGSMVLDACTFNYKTGAVVPVVCNISGSGGTTGGSVTDCEVTAATGLTVPSFLTTFPAAIVSPWTRIQVLRNRLIGTVSEFVSFGTNAEKGHITVNDNWVQEISNGTIGAYKSLIYTKASGGASPRHAYVIANGNVYDGAETVYIAGDFLAGVQIRASYSTSNNFGFVDVWNGTGNNASGGLDVQGISAKLKGSEKDPYSGYLGMQTKLIGAGVTETFEFRASSASLMLFQSSTNNETYAMFTAGNTVKEILSGTQVTVGTNTDPGGTNIGIWSSALGVLNVKNNTAVGRVMSVWVFAPS